MVPAYRYVPALTTRSRAVASLIAGRTDLESSVSRLVPLESAEHHDQQRGSILAAPRLLHLVVMRPAVHFSTLSTALGSMPFSRGSDSSFSLNARSNSRQ